jgi:branched-chain amino acid transport system permease protein
MFYQTSGEAVVWAVVGGVGTLLGPIVGTSLLILLREVVSTHWEHYSLIVGALAIIVVIVAPRGLMGLWRDWFDRSRGREKSEPQAVRRTAPRTEP